MSELAQMAALLALQGAGLFEVAHRDGSEFMRAARVEQLLPPLETLLWEGEPQINAVPIKRPGHYLERVPSRLIWARTTSGRSIAALRRFRPAPDVVLREGATVRYVAFWALQDGLTLDGLERANRRLAKAFQTPYTSSTQDFTFHLPGTVLRSDRRRPIRINLVRYEPTRHHVLDVVGKLKDPPTEEEKREMREAAWERQAAAKKAARERAERELELAADVGVAD